MPGQGHAEPVGADALARVDQEAVHFGLLYVGVGQRRRHGLGGQRLRR